MLICVKRQKRSKLVVKGQFKAKKKIILGKEKLIVDNISGNYNFDDSVPELMNTRDIDYIRVCGFPFYPMGRAFNIAKLKNMVIDRDVRVFSVRINNRGSTMARDWFEFKEDDYYL